MINDQQKITFSVNCASYKVQFLLLSPVNVCPYYSCLSLLFKFFFPSQAILSYSCLPFLLQSFYLVQSLSSISVILSYTLMVLSCSPILSSFLFIPVFLSFCPIPVLLFYSCLIPVSLTYYCLSLLLLSSSHIPFLLLYFCLFLYPVLLPLSCPPLFHSCLSSTKFSSFCLIPVLVNY